MSEASADSCSAAPEQTYPELRPRAVLICHADSALNRVAIGRWLASFTDLVGIVLIDEPKKFLWRRLRNEYRRVGLIRVLDVLAFRAFYAVALSRKDNKWMARRIEEVCSRFPEFDSTTETFITADPNSPEALAFLRRKMPQMAVARCKHILREAVFSVPTAGTFVMHPGICPEYRNAHGAFWALATGDRENVGLTLLKVDSGVDTGPIYGYYYGKFDESRDSHIAIMTELALQNLDAMRVKMLDVVAGRAERISTTGRKSKIWGQPWLSSYLRWKRRTGRRRNARADS